MKSDHIVIARVPAGMVVSSDLRWAMMGEYLRLYRTLTADEVTALRDVKDKK